MNTKNPPPEGELEPSSTTKDKEEIEKWHAEGRYMQWRVALIVIGLLITAPTSVYITMSSANSTERKESERQLSDSREETKRLLEKLSVNAEEAKRLKKKLWEHVVSEEKLQNKFRYYYGDLSAAMSEAENGFIDSAEELQEHCPSAQEAREGLLRRARNVRVSWWGLCHKACAPTYPTLDDAYDECLEKCDGIRQ